MADDAFGPVVVGFDGTASGADAVAPSGFRQRAAGRLARLGVAYIDTPESAGALDLGVRLARRTGAALRLYTVVPGEAEVMPLFIGTEPEREYVGAAREIYRGH